MFKQHREFRNLIRGSLIAAAILALASLTPAAAFAQTLTLNPPSSINIAGGNHTVTATLTGVTGQCFEIGVCTGGGDDGEACRTSATCDVTCSGVVVSNDGSFTSSPQSCTSDVDCADPNTDDFCSFSGFPVGFQVTGTNSQDTAVNLQSTDVLGNVSFNYPDTNGAGVDSIRACADLFVDPSELTSDCLGEADSISPPPDPTDVASNTVTKNWTAELAGTVDLEPLSAVNSVNTITPAQHTVTATITGVARCTGGTNDGKLCTDNFACTGGGTCADKSNLTVGFNINSGPNKGDKGWFTTDGTGVAALTYSDTGGAGLDVLQACLDADPSSPGIPDENRQCTGGTNDGFSCFDDTDCTGGGLCKQLVSNCINDTSEPDFKSDTVTKRWDPTITVQNKDGVTGLFSTDPAYNPIGSSHTVQATVLGAANICFGGDHSQDYVACSDPSDCVASGGSCGVAGYPVFFGVTSGPNVGDITTAPGWGLTDSTGLATISYTDNGGAGIDTIGACVDADPEDFGTLPDSGNYTQCVGEYPAEADIPSSNTVTKYWLSRYVTGGGKAIKTAKTWDSFGGVVGQKPGSSLTVGEWDETVHPNSGGNIKCHWKTFTGLAFSCTGGSCGANPNTVQFTATGGKCVGLAGTPSATVTIVDGFKKPDSIKVTSSAAALAIGTTPMAAPGNFTLHP